MESYKHQFAKETLASWCREVAAADIDRGPNPLMFENVYWRTNRGAPGWGIWVEYPVCLNRQNEIVGLDPVWDESNWDKSEIYGDPPDNIYLSVKEGSLLNQRPPTYDEVIAMGLTPILIFDVAIQHKGTIIHAFEVVHKNGISDTKLEYLKRACRYSSLQVYTIDADWILSRVKCPEKLELAKVI